MPNHTGKNSGPDTKVVFVYVPLGLFKRIKNVAVEDHGRSISKMAMILIEEALKLREAKT